MNRPTLGNFRNSAGARRIGLCNANQIELADRVNEAQERLLKDPLAPDTGWWGGHVTMRYTVQRDITGSAYITTPWDIARVIVTDVCRRPVFMRNPFYEYLQFGIGLQPKACNQPCGGPAAVYDRDSVPTLGTFVAGRKIRVYTTDVADNGLRFMPQGLDQNNMPVLSTDTKTQLSVSGELMRFGISFEDSLNVFNSISGFLKDVTSGPIMIFQVDPNTGEQFELSSMAWNETNAQYRRYLITNLPCNCCPEGGPVQINTQCKLDLVPAKSDSDNLLIQCIPALVDECQAIEYSTMDSANASKKEAEHHAKALRLLNGELDHYRGKTQTAIAVPLFGTRDRVRPQRI